MFVNPLTGATHLMDPSDLLEDYLFQSGVAYCCKKTCCDSAGVSSVPACLALVMPNNIPIHACLVVLLLHRVVGLCASLFKHLVQSGNHRTGECEHSRVGAQVPLKD